MATALADAYASAACGRLEELCTLFETDLLDKPTEKKTKPAGLGTFATKKLGGTEETARVKERCIAFLRPAFALRHAEQDRFDHMRRQAAFFVTLYRRRLAAEGRIAFDELLRLTRDLLRNFPTIAARLQSNISLLLLDEVQDTDPVQYDIVRELRRPRSGSSPPGIFLVGDPKQSIYRFRGADIAAFQDEIDQWDAIKLDLDSNFRSDPRILIAVNRLFTRSESAWIEAPRIQPHYQPLSPVLKEKGEDPVVKLWTIEDDSPDGKKLLIDKARRAEGVVIAESIAERIQAGASPGEFAILMRKLTQVEPYLRALRRCGVPFLVDGGRKFAKRPEVREFLALAKAVVHPADTSARFAFFRSTLGAVPDDEFAAHIAGGGSLDADSEKPDASCCPQLAAAWTRLEEASARRARGDDAGWLQWLLQFGPLQILHAASFEGAQRIANLERLVQTATLRLRRDGLSIEETLERLGDEDSPVIDRDATLADAGRNAVRIMTIHGAKGLEFPYVYLPAAGEPSKGPSGKGLKVRRQRAGAKNACHGVSMDHRHDLVGSFARIEEDRHAEAELQRLLYVATTRAKNSLTLVRSGKPPNTLKGWALTLEAWSNSDTDGVEHRVFQAFADRLLDSDRKPRCVLSPPVGQDIAPCVHTPRVLAETPATSPAGNEGFSIAATIGTVLHRALEILPAREPEQLATFVDRTATACIQNLALDESEALELRRETTAIATAFSSGTLGERWKTIEILGREVPLLSQGDARRGSIDLIYRDTESSGNLVLVDYKTDRTTDDSQLIERHRRQMERYADGLRNALSLSGDSPLRRELWLLRQDRIISA
jgi:ATP-dependent helicase/nuclease subunit A